MKKLNSNHRAPKLILTIVFCGVYVLSFSSLKIFAEQGDSTNTKKDDKIIEKVNLILNGFTIGTDTRIFPYASLEDWFDPYGGLKLGHRSFWNSVDRVLHHFKFETLHDYSWKLRYLANSLSTENTKFSFLFKVKFDRDAYFYGIGNSTSKSERSSTTYSSVFFGGEIRKNVSNIVVLRWSPGFWTFKSGLSDGGEFERASDANYVTSRFTISDITAIDYWKASMDNQWSAYAEIGLPGNSSVSSYARFNLQSMTRLPLLQNSKFGIVTRLEFLIASNRDLVPYFAMPEVGSRTGLRGFSKERFRNFALTVINFEYSYPVSSYFEGFLLSDLATTASDPTDLLSKKIHQTFGFGLRFLNSTHQLSIGAAAGREGWKLFSAFAIGSPW